MKEVINGKTYNTETAKEIARWDNGLPYDHFCYRSEALYRKRTGEYFLANSGIIRLTPEEAQDWLCENAE